jgi:transcriptional antiterminator NusG
VASKWYIVNTLSGQEQKVAKALAECIEQKGFKDKFEEIIVPVEQVSEVKKGKKVTTERRILPGYIILKMHLDEQTWNIVKNMPKVAGILGGSGKPVAVPESQILHILKQVEEGSVPKEHEITFAVGEVIKIIDGPFESFSGAVDKIDEEKKRLTVSVSIFGRMTPVDLEFNQVQKEN